MNNTKVSIAAILTCHNRKKKTLTCLADLMNQDEISKVDLHVYLVDDGSTDGTSDAVKQKFPQVNILQGDGTLYWNGGMRFAFSIAKKSDYDYYLWLLFIRSAQRSGFNRDYYRLAGAGFGDASSSEKPGFVFGYGQHADGRSNAYRGKSGSGYNAGLVRPADSV